MPAKGQVGDKGLSSRVGCILVGAALLLFYGPTLVNIVTTYLAPGSFYAHGFLMPFACIFLYRQKKERLDDLPRSSSRWGIPVILFGCLLHLFGLRGSVSFASGISIPIVLLGFALYHFGTAYTREILPILGLLLFMVPLPYWVLYRLTFSLKMAAAAVGSSIAKAFGLPIAREGINIHLPNGISFAIEDPCSGLRSIVALSAIAYILAVLVPVSLWKKWLIFLAATPLAWASNIVRVVVTIFIVYFMGHAAASDLLHMLVGFMSFILALILLLVWSICLLYQEKREA